MNLIEKAKNKIGRLIRVWNTNQAKLDDAKPWYISVYVKDIDETNGRILLFTPKELEAAEYRAKQNREDLTINTFSTDLID